MLFYMWIFITSQRRACEIETKSVKMGQYIWSTESEGDLVCVLECIVHLRMRVDWFSCGCNDVSIGVFVHVLYFLFFLYLWVKCFAVFYLFLASSSSESTLSLTSFFFFCISYGDLIFIHFIIS